MTNVTFSGPVYDKLKWFVSIVLPAISALYVGLAEIYEWSNVTQVVGTLTLVTAFLGVLLGLSTRTYNHSDAPYDGNVVVERDPGTGNLVYGLELDKDPEEIQSMKSIAFKVVDHGAA